MRLNEAKQCSWGEVRQHIIQRMGLQLPTDKMESILDTKIFPEILRGFPSFNQYAAHGLVRCFFDKLMETRTLPCILFEQGVVGAIRNSGGEPNRLRIHLERLFDEADRVKRAFPIAGPQGIAMKDMLDRHAVVEKVEQLKKPIQINSRPEPKLVNKTYYHENNINKPGQIWGIRNGDHVTWYQEDLFCTKDYLHERISKRVDPALYDHEEAERDYKDLVDKYRDSVEEGRHGF